MATKKRIPVAKPKGGSATGMRLSTEGNESDRKLMRRRWYPAERLWAPHICQGVASRGPVRLRTANNVPKQENLTKNSQTLNEKPLTASRKPGLTAAESNLGGAILHYPRQPAPSL